MSAHAVQIKLESERLLEKAFRENSVRGHHKLSLYVIVNSYLHMFDVDMFSVI